MTFHLTPGIKWCERVRNSAPICDNVNDDPSGIVTIDGIAKQGEILTVNLSQLIEPDGFLM